MKNILSKVQSFCWAKRLTRHKAIEVENYITKRESCDIFKLWLGMTTKGDHAGFRFSLDLLQRWSFNFNIYDSRHWNWEKDRWYDPGEEMIEHFRNVLEDKYEEDKSAYHHILLTRGDDLAEIAHDWFARTGIRVSPIEAAALWRTYSFHESNEWNSVGSTPMDEVVEYYDRIYYLNTVRKREESA